MKAGTGTKMALNMLSTGVMIKVGKTYGNMVGSHPRIRCELLQLTNLR